MRKFAGIFLSLLIATNISLPISFAADVPPVGPVVTPPPPPVDPIITAQNEAHAREVAAASGHPLPPPVPEVIGGCGAPCANAQLDSVAPPIHNYTPEETAANEAHAREVAAATGGCAGLCIPNGLQGAGNFGSALDAGVPIEQVFADAIAAGTMAIKKSKSGYLFDTNWDTSKTDNKITVVATKKGAASRKVTLVLNEDGDLVLNSKVNLKGYQLNVKVDGKVKAKILVTK